ncbi:hypothetical protein [Embleya sp. AB8]|uniref:hypothetical protein n=1 Tax=Embleya sp. AB8 TaxID=3156304 RepID=UPI003C77EED5
MDTNDDDLFVVGQWVARARMVNPCYGHVAAIDHTPDVDGRPHREGPLITVSTRSEPYTVRAIRLRHLDGEEQRRVERSIAHHEEAARLRAAAVEAEAGSQRADVQQ